MTHDSVAHFTRAMEFKGLAPCPQDGRWQIPTDSDICTEVETISLVFGFVRALRPRVVVETGCNVGCVSKAICEALEANGGPGKLITCDTNLDALQQTVRRYDNPLWMLAYHETGLWAVQQFASIADLYWIDSSEDGRAQELEWLRAHGKPGAVVLVHDTSLMRHLADIVRSFPRHVLLPGPRGLGIITL